MTPQRRRARFYTRGCETQTGGAACACGNGLLISVRSFRGPFFSADHVSPPFDSQVEVSKTDFFAEK